MKLDLFNCLHSYVQSCQRHLKNECNIFVHCQRTDFVEHSTSHDCQPKIDWTSFMSRQEMNIMDNQLRLVWKLYSYI